MVVINAECVLDCKYYEYNDSVLHQCVGILPDGILYGSGKRPFDPIDGMIIIFCGNCGVYFAIQGAHLESGDDVYCVACGDCREVEGIPADFDDLPVIDNLDDFLKMRDEMDAIIGA